MPRELPNGLGETVPRGGPNGLGETVPRGVAATDAVFRMRRIAGEIWTELEDILPAVAAGWLRTG